MVILAGCAASPPQTEHPNQNYEIGPYVLGQPTAFLPYSLVQPLMREQLAIMQADNRPIQ